jgi:hypothetical protein
MPRIAALGKRWRSVAVRLKVFCCKARQPPWFGRKVMRTDQRAAQTVERFLFCLNKGLRPQ